MTRLIDADDIRWCDQFDHDGNLRPYKIAYSDEMPPTIDAIPITFIWDFMNHIEEEIAQTDDSDPRMAGLCARHNALNALLRAWKEEGQE